MTQYWRILTSLLIIIGSLELSTIARAEFKGNLTVEIDGLKNQKGQICFSLFASSKGFPDRSQGAVEAKCVKITDAKPKLNFGNLKAGTYAVAVFHDVQGKGVLQRNSLGIPTDGFGFSNNPAIIKGVPKFGDAAIFVAGQTNINIDLVYIF